MNSARRRHGLLGSLPVAAFLALTVMTWRRTGDPLVDWGRELYTAWRLSEGDALYVDVASLFGALSQNLNGAWFTLFGPGQVVLTVANLCLVAGAGWLILGLLTHLADRTTALLGVLVFFTVFAFGHLTRLGNYNFITPYAHEATHGTILCLLMLWALARPERDGSRPAAWLAGAACGATWLTKPEIALAATATLVVVGPFLARGPGGRRSMATLALGLATPIAVMGGALVAVTGPRQALAHLATPFAVLVAVDPLTQDFYRESMGFDRPLASFVSLIAWTAGVGLAAVLIGVLDRRFPGERVARPARWIPTVVAVVGAVLVPWLPVLSVARALPILAIGAAVVSLHSLIRRRAPEAHERSRQVGLAALAILSLGFLAKLGLRPRFHHYGFYLALPGTLLVVVLAVHALPRWARKGGGTGVLARRTAAACLALVMLGSVAQSYARVYARTHELASGRDRILATSPAVDPRTTSVERTLAALASEPETASLAIVPEGAAFAYWLRRPLAVPYPALLPPETQTFGDTTILRAFQESEPDILVRVDRDWAEYLADPGVGMLPGAPRLSRWLEMEYCLAWSTGERAEEGREHRIRIYRPRVDSACGGPSESRNP